mmetsp:Transcript_4559/g.18784  ORF Transcript_4559/g.18784 Transcript_4559/m.18784 type:complete len:214 (-) Transcript_4559:160-801(-)
MEAQMLERNRRDNVPVVRHSRVVQRRVPQRLGKSRVSNARTSKCVQLHVGQIIGVYEFRCTQRCKGSAQRMPNHQHRYNSSLFQNVLHSFRHLLLQQRAGPRPIKSVVNFGIVWHAWKVGLSSRCHEIVNPVLQATPNCPPKNNHQLLKLRGVPDVTLEIPGFVVNHRVRFKIGGQTSTSWARPIADRFGRTISGCGVLSQGDALACVEPWTG